MCVCVCVCCISLEKWKDMCIMSYMSIWPNMLRGKNITVL